MTKNSATTHQKSYILFLNALLFRQSLALLTTRILGNIYNELLFCLACRETAFVYAITAAAVSYSISRACADGHLRSCTCDNPRKEGVVTEEGWQWGGCGDNIRFADKFARKFLNSAEMHKDFRARVNMHNNEAGQTVRET